MAGTISDAARLTGLSVKTVRYYEDIGLVAAIRGENGYRQYGDTEIRKLRFVQRARRLGFSVDDCRRLLSLYEDKARSSADVKAIASAHLQTVESKLAELERLRDALRDLIEHCAGDMRPDCPIIDDFAGLEIENEYPAAAAE